LKLLTVVCWDLRIIYFGENKALRYVSNLPKFRSVNRSLSLIIFDIFIFRGEKFSGVKMDATLVFVYALQGVTSLKTVPLLVPLLVASLTTVQMQYISLTFIRFRAMN
jgi:hypothetical protein